MINVTPSTAEILTSYRATQAGKVSMWAGPLPTGSLDCAGAAVSRTTYAALFAVLGTTYGAGNGSTTFNVPDLRDKFPVGIGSSYALGATGGAATHTLIADEMPAHSHSYSEATSTEVSSGNGAYINGQPTSGTTSSAGGSLPHNNLPPYVGVRFIIWTGL